MKVLRVIGWLIIPYIMIIFQWKKLDNPRRAAGVVWAAIILVVAITNQNAETETASKDVPKQTEPAPEQPANNAGSTPEQTNTGEQATSKEVVAEGDTKPTEPTETPTPSTIGMNAEEFRVAFNKASEGFKAGLTIDKITIEEGESLNTFKYMFTQNLGIVGAINKKDGSVRDVMIIGSGDGSFSSGADIILAMGVLIATTNPDLSTDDRGNILKELGLIGNDIMDLSTSTVRNGIKYSLNTSKTLGIMFTASAATE